MARLLRNESGEYAILRILHTIAGQRSNDIFFMRSVLL